MSAAHLSRQYDLELERIRSKVLMMGGLAQSQFNDALACYRTGNSKQAEQVIIADRDVNRLEMSLDDECSSLIVRRQPAADDLRMVMATLKVITDLERIGDEAAKIARFATMVHERAGAGINHHDTVRAIAVSAAGMLHDALDAFARLDGKQAQEIIARDAMVDYAFRAILRTTVNFMMEDPRTISAALDTLWVAKSIERIGDHAKNIAEYVIYVVDGKDIRHSSRAIAASGDF